MKRKNTCETDIFTLFNGKKSMSKLNIPLQPQQKENLLLNPLC